MAGLAGRRLPQVLCEHEEHVKELIDQVQGEQLRGLLGPRQVCRLAPQLHAFVPQVGHPQGVQQGDYVGEQLRLQKPKTKYRTLILSHPVLSWPSVRGRLGGSHRGTMTVV